MKQSTLEWIAKAEGDWVSTQREARARNAPNYDAACFHAQQCAEKYLKARLEEAGMAFDKTHNLINLLGQVLPIEPSWNVLLPDLKVLNGYAIDYRYPGLTAGKIEAKNAIKHCRVVRKAVRLSFSLPI
jgi:HEPN domain-containing protein